MVYYRSALRGPSSLHFFFKSSARETGRYRSGGEGEACVRWVWGGGRRHRGGHTRNPRGAMGGGGQTQTYHLKPIKHCPLKANASCLIFPLHQGKMSSAQPLSGLDSPSQGSRGQLTSTPSYHSPPSLSPFTTGKATRAHPALAAFRPYLP